MSDRISIKQLNAMVARLNRLTGSPETYCETKPFRANIGNYHVAEAYGGVCVERVHTIGGGITRPIWEGFVPKREAHNRLSAYIRGIESANNGAN